MPNYFPTKNLFARCILSLLSWQYHCGISSSESKNWIDFWLWISRFRWQFTAFWNAIITNLKNQEMCIFNLRFCRRQSKEIFFATKTMSVYDFSKRPLWNVYLPKICPIFVGWTLNSKNIEYFFSMNLSSFRIKCNYLILNPRSRNSKINTAITCSNLWNILENERFS